MHAVGVLVHWSLLHAHVIDADFGVRHTTAIAGLWIGFVLDLPVTSCWTCTRPQDGNSEPVHPDCCTTITYSRKASKKLYPVADSQADYVRPATLVAERSTKT